VPTYFDFLIDAFHAGQIGRNVHLGYWNDPPPLASACSAAEFAQAQARLTDMLIGLVDLQPGQVVLDVGCGFGGTLAALAQWPRMCLAGINVDRRQLDICRSVPAPVGGTLSLVLADACALPFPAESFDRVFCVEAMFHFRDRRIFLRETAGVLRAGGRLVISDILLRRPDARAAWPAAAVEAVLPREYGPWPQLWLERKDLEETAAQAGLRLDRAVDVTCQTLPSYRITAPQPADPKSGIWSAGQALRWLHSEGYLSYLCMSFVRP
jgi:cyclopropane fatty-acyl-phospholipid synthase-like methyltransferase